MTSMIGGRYYISREELAQFVVDQFNLIANVRMLLFQRITNTGSLDLIISDHGRGPIAEFRMEIR